MRLFISYAHVDKYRVNELVEILRQGGHEPWFDYALLPGQDWQAKLGEAIESADAFVYVLTPESVASDWCQWEFGEAIRLNKPIIPVLMQKNTKVPTALKRVQYVDFSDGPTATATARLMGGLLDVSVKVPPPATTLAPRAPSGPPPQAQTQQIPKFLGRPRWQGFSAVFAIIIVIVAIVVLSQLQPAVSNSTPTASAQLDVIATEAVLQRTVDARGTEKAALLVENTHIAETQAALSVTTDTTTSEPTDTVVTETPSPPSSTPNLTDTAVSPTSIPSPVVTYAPVVTSTTDTITLTIFRDDYSFTLYMPESDASISLVGLEFRVNVSADAQLVRRLDRDYAAFLGLPFNNVATLGAICLRLVQTSSDQPVPQACQGGTLLIPQQLATADLFWLDTAAKLERTVFVYLGDTLLGVCGPQDACPLNWPLNGEVAGAAPALTPTPGYPCEGAIIFRSGAMNQVKVSPMKDAPNKTSVQQGSTVQILDSRNNYGGNWYQIEYDGNTGWIATDLVEPSVLCPK